jgi:hypothetical protein
MAKIYIADLSLDTQISSLEKESFLKELSSTNELNLIHGGEPFTIAVIGIGLGAAALGATLGAHDRQRWGAWGG